jgi:DNA-binding transcriptional regulator YdaS (Cro superfamily)
MNTENIKRAISICGGQVALAQKIGVSQPAVHNWLKGITPVGPRFVIPIEAATGGQVSRYDLRPDIYPPIEKKSA